MPSRPPILKQRSSTAKPPANWHRRASRQERGYGRDHERMRERVLVEEPICRECLKHGMVNPTEIADHIIPKAEGGTDDRDNYQGLCSPHSKAKTAAEAARARKRRRA